MAEAIPPWLHILAATLWVGPQFFIFFAQVPALRAINDVAVRHRVTDIFVHRFNILAWAALMVLVLTGISNIFDRTDDFAVFEFEQRYVWILIAKLSLVAVTTALTFWHSFILGPRLLALQVPAQNDDISRSTYQTLRIHSIVLSVVNLLTGMAILFLAALLSRLNFSLQNV
ncbi:MAG: CopD family protein [Dehalococcoidia bacterium]